MSKTINQSPPSMFTGSDVIELTDDDFDFNDGTEQPTLKMDNPGMIMFFSSMCPHCISKRDDYMALAKKLNTKDGYQIYSVHTMDPATGKIGRTMKGEFIPTFYEADGNGKLVPYDENFSQEGIMGRANLHQKTSKNTKLQQFARKSERGIILPSVSVSAYPSHLQKGPKGKMKQTGGGCGCNNRNQSGGNANYCNGITKTGRLCNSKGTGVHSDASRTTLLLRMPSHADLSHSWSCQRRSCRCRSALTSTEPWGISVRASWHCCARPWAKCGARRPRWRSCGSAAAPRTGRWCDDCTS